MRTSLRRVRSGGALTTNPPSVYSDVVACIVCGPLGILHAPKLLCDGAGPVSTPSGTMAEEAEKNDAAMEAEKQRLQMAAVLYRALRGAEGDLANARPRSRADLAGACHSKLQYDFPIVNAAEVDALVEEMATEIAEGTTPGSMVYPVTAALVNAAVEGACKPAPGTGAAPGISGKSNGDERKEDAGAGGVGDEPAVDRGAVRTAYQRLCATALVYFTSRVLAMSDDEADDALRGYRVEVETAPARG